MHHIILTLIFLLTFSLFVSNNGDSIVVTKYGAVSGKTFSLPNGKLVSRYLGIPFTKPPVGALRFQPPEEPNPWDGVFEANTLNDACMQAQGANLIWLTHLGWSRYSEDCLKLNIFAPNSTEGGPYPVMVWFHGGGYQSSANIQYPGHFMAGRDVIMVVPNYRLGALGFMSTGDDVAPGNYGLLDQIQALKFVQENIAAFGGDPKQVTLFGQSAGAASSTIMLLSPFAKGLFHQVIAESGSDQAAWAVQTRGQRPWEYTQNVAAQLGCPTENNQVMMDCLRSIEDPMDIISKSFDCNPGYFCLGFAPVVDGKVIPDVPWKMRKEGNFEKVPLLAGQTSEDGSLYTFYLIPSSWNSGFNRSEFERVLDEELLAMFYPLAPDRAEDTFEAMNFYYSPWPHVDDGDANREAFNTLITDFAFGAPGDIMLKSQAQYADTYAYVLSYRSENAVRVFPEWLGVPHNGELPYVMAWPLLQTKFAIRWDSGIIVDIVDWNDLDMEWAEYFQIMWSNFAKYGNPTPEPLPAPGDSQPTVWKKFNEANYTYLDMGPTRVQDTQAYRQQNFAFLLEYMMHVMGLPSLRPGEDEDTKQGDETIKKTLRKSPRVLNSHYLEKKQNELIKMLIEENFKKHP